MSVNAGSCVKLAHYLDKESGSGKFFFSQNQDSVPLTEVIQKIDNNISVPLKWDELNN